MSNIKFYRRYYNRLCFALFSIMIAILLLNVGVLVCWMARDKPDYYATSMEGTLHRLIPLDSIDQNA